MNGGGRQKDVQPGSRRPFDRLIGRVDIGAGAPCKAGDDHVLALARNGLDGGEIPLRGSGKAGLEHVYVQALEPPRHLQLFGQRHAAAGSLLAVPQRGIEDQDLVAHKKLLFFLFRPNYSGQTRFVFAP